METLLKKGFVTTVILLTCISVFSQQVQLKELAKLSEKLHETSGLCVTGKTIWSHNDSKGEPVLYGFDQTGKITDAIYIRKTNVDWEGMAKDDKGNLYIGDFGNVDNKRRDLKIYIISHPDSIPDKITDAKVISYSYSDQKNFPPLPVRRNFDMEAMVWYKDSIFLFSKNRTEPFSGYTKMYRLPAQPGTHVAQLIDSIFLGKEPMITNWVTGATISPDKKKLALLGHNKLWLFTCFQGSNFLSGMMTTLTFSTFTQKEALCFINNNEMYITDELTQKILGGKLYYLNLADVKLPACK